MNQRTQTTRSILLAWLMPLTLLIGACSNLAGDQLIAATFTPSADTSTAFTEDDAPPVAPDLRNGAILYQQNCTSCHGTTGDGQGELVQDGSVPEMPSFLDIEHMRDQTPADYYQIVTNGRIENMMPPWADALTLQERWDVAMYVHTLHYSQEQVALGQQVYSEQCAECHGETGEGDGPEMVDTGRSTYDMTDLYETASLSDSNMYVNVAEGIGDEMPAFADELSEDEMWASVAYSRTLALQNFQQSRDAELRLAEPGEGVVISGNINNGTEGSSLPASLVVNLSYGSAEVGIESQTTQMQPDGSFTFEEVPAEPGQEYAVYVVYNNQIFLSDVLTGDEMMPRNLLDITIYETTEDTSVLTVTEILSTVAIDRLDVEGLTSGLVFNQAITFNNASDRLFILAAPTQSGQSNVSLLIQLPPGAISLTAPNDPRFIAVPDQFMLIYTEPLQPGETTLNIPFFLPYEQEAVIDQPWQYPIDGEVIVRLAPPGLELISETLNAGEDEVIDDITYRTYRADVDQASGESIVYTLQGELFGRPANADGNVITSDVLLPIVLVGIVLLIVIVIFLVLRAQRQPNSDTEIQQLVRQIAELDAQHEQGQINHDLYQRQRADLKARLTTLMSQTGDES